ncbi:MAG: ATP-dependent Clp protease ATP-binding subunit, partial [Cyclobacteriaceae bacterium]
EFLGRLTEIVPFAPISEAVVLKIFDIQLGHLLKALANQNIHLRISAKARKYLAESGHTPKYGARPLAGVIRSQVRAPLSRMIVSGKIMEGNTAYLDLDRKGNLKWKISNRK